MDPLCHWSLVSSLFFSFWVDFTKNNLVPKGLDSELEVSHPVEVVRLGLGLLSTEGLSLVSKKGPVTW